MKRLEFTVDTPAIFREIATHFSSGSGTDSPGIVMSLNRIRVGLARIATRAIATDDQQILRELCALGCVNPVEEPPEPATTRLEKHRAAHRDPGTATRTENHGSLTI